jgi:hypothetical protein
LELASVTERIEEVRRQLDEIAKDEAPDEDEPNGASLGIRVTPGLGVDCRGNLLIVDHEIEINPRDALNKSDLRRLEHGEAEGLWISICYCEEATEPTRPAVTHACTPSENCTHARVRESSEIRVTLDRPDCDDCCESCCCQSEVNCDAGCLVLAHVSPLPANNVPNDSVHNEVRRMLGRHPLTTIVGVNWWQGATYDVQAATDLAVSGFIVEFSNEVHTDTLRRGVVDVIVYEGGKGNVGDMHYVTGGLDLPDTPLVKRLVWKSESDETFQNGDQVLFRLRGDFILDKCCHPVDAENVGGRVPALPEAAEPSSHPTLEECTSPPNRPGPWQSGDGHPGGSYESWFYVEKQTGEAT